VKIRRHSKIFIKNNGFNPSRLAWIAITHPHTLQEKILDFPAIHF
jgi:hypothetical protein